jgi:two-component system response regulator MprA
MTGARILVVDDEADVRSLLERMLRYRGYVVAVAKDASEGLELVRASSRSSAAPRFDVVLVDLIMPSKDGFVMIREMERAAPHLLFVIISGMLLTAEQKELLREMGVGYHAKPFRNEEVVATIERLISERCRGQGGAAGAAAAEERHHGI